MGWLSAFISIFRPAYLRSETTDRTFSLVRHSLGHAAITWRGFRWRKIMFSFAVLHFVSDTCLNGFGPSRARRFLTGAVASAVICAALNASGTALAGQAEVDATYKDVEQTLGSVPSFLHQVS